MGENPSNHHRNYLELDYLGLFRTNEVGDLCSMAAFWEDEKVHLKTSTGLFISRLTGNKNTFRSRKTEMFFWPGKALPFCKQLREK